MSIRPLVDLDSLVYRTGFATKEGEPVENSLHNIKKTLSSILEQYESDDPVLVLSGKTNFRHDYCKVLPQVGPKNSDGTPWIYKGNRIGSRKPVHYDDIRSYLVNQHGAIITENEEADDYIGSLQYTSPPRSTCIVAQDKDFNTIKGYHHNWVNGKKWNMSEEDANLFLLYQVIMGDKTDHIPGIDGLGKVKAKKILDENGRDVKRIKEVIRGLYKNQYGKYWREVLDETTTLLFLKREEDKTYVDYIGSW